MAHGKRSIRVSPWHFCQRCGERVHLSDMSWERGVLVGPECVDKGFIGERELEMAGVFTTPSVEGAPDPKLTPTTASEGGDDIIFNL